MSRDFSFKRFTVSQPRSAMKVGTDGVLLGAWAHITPEDRRILDVGTGTGLVALMVAQRSEAWGAEIVGVEIDAPSAEDARENFARSEWAGRLSVVECAVQEYRPEGLFDHIISNPPYFVASLTSPDASRTAARHTTSLSFEELARSASRLLTAEGRLSLVLPYDAVADMTLAAARVGLFLVRRTDVRSKQTAQPIRSLLEYGFAPHPTLRTDLTIHIAGGDYSPEYRTLTREFYLKF